MRLSYVVPVHNEEEILEETTTTLVERLREFPGSEVLLIENGSSDSSAEIAQRLAKDLSEGETTVRSTSCAKGFGNAYRAGIGMSTGELVVLTAADLPFEFTDLDAVLSIDPRPRVAIGSKAHPASNTSVDRTRRLMSEAYRLFRKVLIKLNVGDSQGTILIDGDLVRDLLPSLRAHDYFVSTEILAFAVARGEDPVEVPVDYLAQRRTSKVKPLADGWSMTKQLWELRGRLKDTR